MTRIRRRRLAALAVAHLLCLGALVATSPALAMQILDAADHAELAAVISARGVNRIALHGDRIAKVVRAPDGFAVEHDAASGDLYLRSAGPQSGTRAAEAGSERAGRDPVTLFIGTEKGFTYRLTLTPAERDSAQILIRNAAARPDAAPAGPAHADPAHAGPARAGAAAGDPHVAALVRLVRAVARRKPLPGYAIHGGRGAAIPGFAVPGFTASGFRIVETWRGPRFAALVLEAESLPSAGAPEEAGLAGTIAGTIVRSVGHLPGIGRVAALWLAAPGTGPTGGRLAVAVVETGPAGAPR